MAMVQTNTKAEANIISYYKYLDRNDPYPSSKLGHFGKSECKLINHVSVLKQEITVTYKIHKQSCHTCTQPFTLMICHDCQQLQHRYIITYNISMQSGITY